MIDSLELHFVGSVKLDEHKDLARIPNNDPAFEGCKDRDLEGTKALRVEKKVYGRNRVVVVTYNQNLFNAQWLTVQNDIAKAAERLSLLSQKLKDRVDGVITKGRAPTLVSVQTQCKKFLSRQHMKKLISVTVTEGHDNIPRMDYAIDSDALHDLSNTYLGKNILITSRKEWDNAKVVTAYRSQFIIEDVFNTDFHSRYSRQSSTQIRRSRLSPRFCWKAMELETVFVVFQHLSELGYELFF